ncbi:MAG: hypothetical protein JWM71_1878, partial [Solirubrobacteraceae bacterium]|nr:hypothetical protein [Solirubrobacteraceae bacterium]
IAYAMYILLNLVSLFSWLCIVFTGKQAEGLQDALNLGVAYITRAAAYFLYLTETYPPFSLEQNAGGVAQASSPGPEPAAS